MQRLKKSSVILQTYMEVQQHLEQLAVEYLDATKILYGAVEVTLHHTAGVYELHIATYRLKWGVSEPITFIVDYNQLTMKGPEKIIDEEKRRVAEETERADARRRLDAQK